jgi:hypothetical protein
LLLQNNGTIPVIDDWGSECKNKSLMLSVGNPDKNNIDIPSWAFATVPSGSTFNVDAALSGASTNHLHLSFLPDFL